jgi:putative hydrolase of the HAD superfamily
MAEISWVWSDFGGVLTPPIAEAFTRVVTAVGVPAAPLRAAIDEVAAELDMRLLEPLERGVLTQAEWGRRLTRVLEPQWRPRMDLGRFGEYWYAGRPLNRPLYERLAALKRGGVRIGLLTNSVREWEPHRRRMLPDDDLFDVRIKSHEIGIGKPDPRLFRIAEEAADVDPDRCLLIDDLDANCTAARQRGWAAILHRDTGVTLVELDRRFSTRPA